MSGVSQDTRRQETAEKLWGMVRGAGEDAKRWAIDEIVEALEEEYAQGRDDEARNEP